MRVLIVEDEYKIAQAIKRFLVRESFAVDTAYDGEDGLNAGRIEPYDLIILDRMLPGGMDGTEICLKLRAANRMMPILMLTAKGQIGQRVEGLNAGADDYLVKPFSFDELLARIRALLRRPHDIVGEHLQLADLTLDCLNKRATRANQIITLSPTEYGLLEYFMRNPGQILSKQNLISHVWDGDTDILLSTVESFITFLRHKIDKPFTGPPLLHTIRGFGYKLDEMP